MERPTDLLPRPSEREGRLIDLCALQEAESLENARLYAELLEDHKRRGELLYSLAHGLRNPLAPLLNAAQILVGRDTGKASESEVAWAAGVIDRQVRELARRVDDLVALSRRPAVEPKESSESANREPVAQSAGGRVRAKRGAAPLRFLVVDDNRDAADGLALMLRGVGDDVRVAYDGPEAVRVAAEFDPEAVLLDIGLPGMNGYDVARNLRRLPSGPGMLLIANTGWGQQDDRTRSKAASFDHHLVKPVRLEHLSALVDARRGPAPA